MKKYVAVSAKEPLRVGDIVVQAYATVTETLKDMAKISPKNKEPLVFRMFESTGKPAERPLDQKKRLEAYKLRRAHTAGVLTFWEKEFSDNPDSVSGEAMKFHKSILHEIDRKIQNLEA